jgi:hypothetical protein
MALSASCGPAFPCARRQSSDIGMSSSATSVRLPVNTDCHSVNPRLRGRAAGTAKDMRKVIRRRIRSEKDGVNVAADVDAVVSINTGEEAGFSHTTVRSSNRVVQGAAAEQDRSKRPPDDQSDPPQEER